MRGFNHLGQQTRADISCHTVSRAGPVFKGVAQLTLASALGLCLASALTHCVLRELDLSDTAEPGCVAGGTEAEDLSVIPGIARSSTEKLENAVHLGQSFRC